ncbi:uncharacterized protein KY384_006836 [Bacidia gigantensis]|uniref:uncharacterized protein n=1 Tax=Bacidia gigantensis TaxID=2732470 RepID=UPI001D036EBC|nr:uncharacterized protein KY384_006836 [Bacidia gigantensis]KAG8527920.1 hypothetical protein KY384_006836 [Bacidia gigantensis]
MADSLSDAEKIRNKRLAKLGNPVSMPPKPEDEDPTKDASSSPNPLPSSPDASSSAVVEPSKPQTNPPESSTQPSKQNPFSQLGVMQTTSDMPKINISSQQTRTPQKRDASGRPSPRAAETLETWEDRHLGNIFKVTFGPGAQQVGRGTSPFSLTGTKSELEESNQPVRLDTTVLDQVLLEAASNVKKDFTPLRYFLECWKRVSRHFKALRKNGEEDPKFLIVKEARRLCMSYCIFAATMPEMFGMDSSESNLLAQHFLYDPEDDQGIDYDFLMEAIARMSNDESVKDVLVGAFEDLSRRLAQMTMNDDFKPYVNALRGIVQYTALVEAITQSPLFLPPSIQAPLVETATFLGPFFRISPLQGDVTNTYFSAPSTRDQGFIANSQRSLRMALQTHQMDLLDIVNKIIKTGKNPRERILDWFAMCCNVNHKRRAMQVDPKTVSSDGFMVNVTVCLDQLCDPFMDASFSKIDRIDVDYLRRNPRVNIKEETKINADQNASDAFYNSPVEGTNNFISEVFFLTLAAHHYGTEAAHSMLSEMDRNLKRMKKHLEDVELERQKILNNPGMLGQFDRAIQKFKDQIEKGTSYKYAVEGVLLDDQNQTRSMQFMRYVIVWLLRLVSPTHNFPQEPLKLPLPLEQGEAFKCLPEYFLEDVVDNFKFITRNLPQIISTTQSDELVMLCITFLRSSEYIKNPYLKGGLITILFTGTVPTPYRTKGSLGDLLNALPFANEHLLHSLIQYYIEAESTGAHTQFYDKFNIRYEIFQIIKCIWSNVIYRDRLSQEAAQNIDFFVRFVNLLLNDVTYVLDESLTHLTKIHDITEELEQKDIEQEERTQKEEALSEAKGRAKSYMQLTNETMAMLKLFTEALAESFTKPEIVQRLADMLDYNLDVMVGPKANNLKVKNRQEYGWEPKQLLADIIDVFLNLRNKENFIFAVARDGRSYKPGNFERARSILKNQQMKGSTELSSLAALAEKFKKAKEADEQAEEDLGEIPDDFLDPILSTFMEDPVILPTSRSIVDRSTIRQHLLSDPTDPFNRAPLKIEEVVPATEMLEKINAFKAERKSQKLAESHVMDTTAG